MNILCCIVGNISPCINLEFLSLFVKADEEAKLVMTQIYLECLGLKRLERLIYNFELESKAEKLKYFQITGEIQENNPAHFQLIAIEL